MMTAFYYYYEQYPTKNNTKAALTKKQLNKPSQSDEDFFRKNKQKMINFLIYTHTT